MARGPRYRVPRRRRREGRTNYYRRLRLLLSKKPRVVVRKSNRHILLQLVVPDKNGDKTLVTARSTELEKYGYKGSTRNTPAAYLTGFLFGKRAISSGFGEGVLDIGLHPSTRGSRIYAALKGAVDAGMNIPHDESIFPSEERIRGEHIAEYASIRSFPGYEKRGLPASELPSHFEEIRSKIEGKNE
ncbi:MAG: 50S ribosomal protein L18 [Candidatus Syntropharchaeia archaeon]